MQEKVDMIQQLQGQMEEQEATIQEYRTITKGLKRKLTKG